MKKSKKKLLSLTGLLLLSLTITACDRSDTSSSNQTTTNNTTTTNTATTSTTIPDVPPTPDTFSYYQNTHFDTSKGIQLIDQELSSNDRLYTAQAIQGLFARKEVTYYVDSTYVTNGTNTDLYYLEETSKKYDFEYTSITLTKAVQDYIASWSDMVKENTWGSSIPLESYNNTVGVTAYTETSGEGYSTPGYILYRPGNFSVNTAATLAGITGFIPVSIDDVEFYKDLGLVEKFNLDNVALSYRWLFNIVLGELSPKGLIHQNYNDGTGYTNKYLKDYGICNKFFHIYYDDTTAVSNSFKKTLHSFLDDNSPIFGYAFSEDIDVAFFSQYGQFLVPTDYTCNLTFHAADIFAGKTFTQPNSDVDKPAEEGKHYVAFVVSDGDNATYWQNTAPFATNYMNASGREDDTFPVTWSITPSLVDLMPDVIDSVYNIISNQYDYFCAPVSGQGYINAGNFAAQDNGSYFADFCSKLDVYMGKSGLRTVTVIGGNSQGNLPQVLKGYASADNVIGGIVYDGSKYFGSVQGGVMWIDGKPFVGPRDSLWETTPAYIAARLNAYESDIHSIDGYSIINVHPWSHSYEDIRTIVGMLNDNIEVCSVDRIMQMMTDNIDHAENTQTFDIPEKNGISISEDYLRQNPSLIPVDPLFNDFLLWEEDWSGSGVSYNSSDAASSNVGAMYKGNISIAKGSKAVKEAFTLPNIDDYWISFNARGDSQDENQKAYIKVSVKIGDEEKVVIENATLNGVRGTGTQHVTGNGWQCFGFPISQYFEDYKNKECIISIEVLSNSDIGIRLDQVTVTERSVDPAINLSNVDIYDNTFDESTEDWLLGEQYQTSQYYWWGTTDRESFEQTGTIQIDCSDGGGDEKRNGNSNMWMAKYYTLPNSNDITLNYKVQSDNPTGAMLKISLYANGKYYVLFDWNVARNELNNTTNSVNLKTLDPNVDWANTKVTVFFEARDGGNNNGVGEACNLDYFETVSA